MSENLITDTNALVMLTAVRRRLAEANHLLRQARLPDHAGGLVHGLITAADLAIQDLMETGTHPATV